MRTDIPRMFLLSAVVMRRTKIKKNTAHRGIIFISKWICVAASMVFFI